MAPNRANEQESAVRGRGADEVPRSRLERNDMSSLADTRRRFMTHFASIGLGSTLAPGIIWARMQDQGTQRITLAMVTEALKLSGIELPEADRQAMVNSANQNLTRYEEVRKIHIPLDVSPPFHFSALAPGIQVNRTRQPFRLSAPPAVKRPSNLEDVAFWPVRHLAELIRTKQVTSVQLTEMYLARLHRYNAKLNCVVTFLDDLAIAQAKQADAEIARGSTRARCTASRGARKTSSRSRATRPRGARRRSRIRSSTTTPASSRCCATRARCSSRSSRLVSSRLAISGSADERTARGIRQSGPADRRRDRRPRRPPAAWASGSGPRRADRFSVQPPAAGSPDSGRRSAASAATA